MKRFSIREVGDDLPVSIHAPNPHSAAEAYAELYAVPGEGTKIEVSEDGVTWKRFRALFHVTISPEDDSPEDDSPEEEG